MHMLSRVRTTAAHCSENVTSMILWALLALLQPRGKTQYTLPQTTNLPESIPIHSFIRSDHHQSFYSQTKENYYIKKLKPFSTHYLIGEVCAGMPAPVGTIRKIADFVPQL